MIFAYIALFILLLLIATVLSYWAGLKLVGVKAVLTTVLKITLALIALQLLLVLLGYQVEQGVLRGALWFAGLIGGFLLWHKLLNRYHQVGIGKSLGAYIIAGIFIWITSLVLAIAAMNFVQSFQIQGPAMSPTLKDGDVVLAYKRGKELELNKIVVYSYNNKNNAAVGRILGLPGQTITIDSNYMHADGTTGMAGKYTLKEDEYYIAGDNRANTVRRIVKANNIVAVVGPTIKKAD